MTKYFHGGSGAACPGKTSLEPPEYLPVGEPLFVRAGEPGEKVIQDYRCAGCGAGLTVVTAQD